MSKVRVSLKSEMAGPFNRDDTIINKHFLHVLGTTTDARVEIEYL